jgi:uncharacterized membrane protein (DUF4010 family)
MNDPQLADSEIFLRLGIALGLGLLVGLQRELAKSQLAGLRTFALITLLGGVAALFDDWVLALTLVGVAGTLAMGNYTQAWQGDGEIGATTEVAALLMALVGAGVVRGLVVPGMVLGGVVAVLLYEKERLHGLVQRLGDLESRAIFRLVVLALIILPLVPNRHYGPYEVLNPREIWWMVVLIVGIGLAGYLALRILGARAGGVTSGVFGGLVSSTATTLSWARHARAQSNAAPLASAVVLLASTVVYVRVLIEIAVVAPSLLAAAAWRLGIVLAAMVVLSWLLLRRVRREDAFRPDPSNPAELRGALVFAALYAAILLAVAWTQERFADEALYVVAFVSGLTDMDALTLSTSRLVTSHRLDHDIAWRLILVASQANLLFKLGIVAVVGGVSLAKRVGVAFAITIAVGDAVWFVT